MKKNLIRFTMLLLCLVTLTVVQAQIIFNEDFSTATVGARLTGYNSWDINSSNCAQGGFCNTGCAWNTIAGTTLSNPSSGYADSPKSVSLGIGVEGPGRCFATSYVPTAGTTQVVYMAALVNFSSCPNNDGTARGNFIQFVSGPFAVFARIGANGSGGSLKFRVAADGNSSPVETTGTTYSFNTTHLVVLKYTFIPGATDQILLYVNPTSAAEPTSPQATVNSSGVNADPTQFKGVQLNTFNAQLTTGIPLGNIGGIRVARTWADLFSVIPVELAAFTATAKGTSNVMDWKTATEINVAHFDVEKSADGATNWTKIGERKAAGNSVALNTYSFVDENPFAVSYYRLKTMDVDGKESVSKVVSVKQAMGKGTFKVFPQPVGDMATIQLESATNAQATLTVLDASGRLVLSKNVVYTEGSNNFNISTQNLVSGLYLIRLDTGLTSATERFVKQ
jgi:Secretion system C-terminal sorting domain